MSTRARRPSGLYKASSRPIPVGIGKCRMKGHRGKVSADKPGWCTRCNQWVGTVIDSRQMLVLRP